MGIWNLSRKNHMKKELIQLFIVENKSASEIGSILGYSTNQIYGKLYKYGIRKNKKKTEWFNSKLIHLTNEEIYLLGFLWADGYLNGDKNKKRSLQCEIVKEDYLDLKEVFDKVGYWGLHLRKASKKKGVSRKERALLTISDTNFVSKLMSFDFDKKSFIRPDKLLKIIPKKKQYLFYRGYSDGDGCFYISNKANQFFLASSYEQDWKHIEQLFSSLNIYKYNIRRCISKLNHRYSLIRVSNKESVKKIVKYLYMDNLSIGLKRKQEKVRVFLSE